MAEAVVMAVVAVEAVLDGILFHLGNEKGEGFLREPLLALRRLLLPSIVYAVMVVSEHLV